MSGKRVKVTVKWIEHIGRDRYRVKIAENDANIVDLDYSKDLYLVVTKNLGRGRYVMKRSLEKRKLFLNVYEGLKQRLFREGVRVVKGTRL